MQNAASLLNHLADVIADRDRLAAEIRRVQTIGGELLANTPEAAGATPQSDLLDLLKAYVLRLRTELEAVKGPPKEETPSVGSLTPEQRVARNRAIQARCDELSRLENERYALEDSAKPDAGTVT